MLTSALRRAIRMRNRGREARYLRITPPAGVVDPHRSTRPRLDIAVVAFGNAHAHAHQHEQLTRLLCDEHRLWVFDNAPDPARRREVRAWAGAAGDGVRYVPLPPGNPHTGTDPSASHGLAL